MSFSFDFSGDDIDAQQVQSSNQSHNTAFQNGSSTSRIANQNLSGQRPGQTESVPVKSHKLGELLSTLPDRISYTTTKISAPQHDRQTLIPRRALFDVRMQIMAEASLDDGGEDIPSARRSQTSSSKTASIAGEARSAGIGDSDIEQNVYEGGFKSWEGALDLARLVLQRGPRKDLDELARVSAVVELGCGTALPSLVLFQHALRNEYSLHFTFADYNESVLRLVTLPNILLVWAAQFVPEAFDPAPPQLLSTEDMTHAEGDLNVTPELLSNFTSSLRQLDISLSLVSGPWSDPLVPLLTPPLSQAESSMLVLAAETIYSPASLTSFTQTLLATLRQAKMSKAIVAAKRVYFGVGGSVDEFKELIGSGGGVVAEVENSGIEGCERAISGSSGGVGRCLLEIQLC